ncbi:MAG: hypothetical protein RL428_999 [Actinomycetota bacterium]|jgi:uncharacterized membrane protein YeiH
MGAATYVVFNSFGATDLVSVIGGAIVVIATRVISIQFDLHLPKFQK